MTLGAKFAAGRVRLAARAIDAALVFALWLPVALYLSPSIGAYAVWLLPGSCPCNGTAVVFAVACWPLVSVPYNALSEGLLGRTLGKTRCGLYVERMEDGERPGLRRAFVRATCGYADWLLFGLVGASAMLWTDRERRLADLAAGTVVVERGKNGTTPKVSGRPKTRPPLNRVDRAKLAAGLEGERRLRKALAPLAKSRHGFHLFFNVEHRAFGDIDALLVGPPGVFVIDAKSHKGTVTADRHTGALLRDGSPFEKNFLAQMNKQAGHVRGTLPEGAPVFWLLCFTRARISANGDGPPAGVCPLSDLVPIFSSARPVLSEGEAAEIAGRIERSYGAAPEPTPGRMAGWRL